MYRVEQHFIRGGPAERGCFAGGVVGTDDNLPFQSLIVLQNKTQHVGGKVVLQVLLVEPMHGRVIHNRNAYELLRDSLAVGDPFNSFAKLGAIDRVRGLLIVDGDFEHQSVAS